MRLLAIDPSLSRTGMAECSTDEPISTYSVETKLRGPQRLAWLRDIIVSRAIAPPRADVAVIEGYSYASKAQGEKLGELGGVIRVGLFEAEIPYTEIAPTKLKRYATGAGNAAKDQVMASAARRADRDFACSDEADAFWLLQMCMARFCPEHVGFLILPAKHIEALRGIEWPDITQRSIAV